jgi:hypothetical protein
MKRKMIFGAVVLAFFVQAQTVFAADYDEDFDKELSRNRLEKAEDILQKRASKMDLAFRLERIILNNIKGFNSDNAIKVAQLLIQHGANVNTVKRVTWRSDGYEYYYEAPLLFITVRSSGLDREKTVQMINLLCRSGANPNARITTGGDARFTALMWANSFKLEWNMAFTKALVENGADVNLQDNDGDTALMYNINEFDVFKYLVENKADLNIRNKKGQTALILAAENEKIDILTYLVERGANINLRDNNGITAASICYDKGQIETYNYLKGKGAIDFQPRQVVQQPAAPAAPSGGGYTPAPPAPVQNPAPSGPSPAQQIVEALRSPLDSGTYSLAGTQAKISITAIAKSGMVTYTNRQGRTSMGNYQIDGNRMTMQLEGYTFVYTITSQTSFSGNGENWVRTGY